jgi:hypothetical protein
MAKTTFANGTVVTAAFLNAINNPVFVDTPDDDGEIAKITNASLSTASGQLLPEWQTFRDTLLVTAGTGLNANYTAGVVTLATGARQAIAAGSVSLTASTTNWVFVNSSGAVAVSTSVPLLGVVLASVVTTATVVSTVTDLRPRFEVKPRQEYVKLFGGSGDEGAYNPSTNETLGQGLYYFSSFTIASGRTITIDKYAQIFVSGNVTINGMIGVTQAAPSSSTFLTLADGGGFSGLTGTGLGNNRGAYNFAVQPFGSGGQNGFAAITSGAQAIPGRGGAGGGGLWIEAAGSITIASTGIITIVGEAGSNGSIVSGTGATASGGGGGSGGTLVLSSLTSVSINSGATINLRGGNGGNAASSLTTGVVNGGGGGGGGQLVVVSPSINIVASPQLNGGTAGSQVVTGSPGSVTGPNTGGGWGGGNGAGGGNGSQTPGSTTNYPLVNAAAGSTSATITRTIKAVA